MATAAMVGGMSLVSNCVVCDIFFEGARAQIQNGAQSISLDPDLPEHRVVWFADLAPSRDDDTMERGGAQL